MPFGFSGIMTGAAIVFFAYIGFDAVSTTAEEAKNPQRDLPIGIIASLVICTVLYIAVAAVLTGIVPVPRAGPEPELPERPDRLRPQRLIKPGLGLGPHLRRAPSPASPASCWSCSWASRASSSPCPATACCPPGVSKVHPRFGTPYITTIITGRSSWPLGAWPSRSTSLAEMTNIGTLFAFVLVCSGVIILRTTRPEAHRPFRVPLVFLVAPLGVLSCLYLMLSLPVLTWVRFLVWLDLGLIIYCFYGRRTACWPTRPSGTRRSTRPRPCSFFGFTFIFNGAMAGLLCLTTMIKLTQIRYWEELKLTPHGVLPFLLAAIAIGAVMMIAGARVKAHRTPAA